jgi:hypothetical protein
MDWRDKRRKDLVWLGLCDPAMLAVRYEETALQNNTPHASPTKISLAAMIEAILDAEAVLIHEAAACHPRPPESDNTAGWSSHNEAIKH